MTRVTKASGSQQRLHFFSALKMSFTSKCNAHSHADSSVTMNQTLEFESILWPSCVQTMHCNVLTISVPYLLRLESPTRSLSMDAPKGVHVKALAGNVDVTAHFDIQLHSTAGLVSNQSFRFLRFFMSILRRRFSALLKNLK